ncbi:MAG: hypothetical protein IPJ04_18665 [Candidatus Eisenbacteria bacterium]|jgi:hypothetical protein|nr:hypothetical protein [Candidatus Eisenbacteria bacterium]
MISRVRLASVAVFLLLSSVAVSHAQQADSTRATQSPARAGRGAIGFQLGSSWFAADGDYTEGALPRLTFEGSYRYVMSKNWQWQVSPYFTWAAYGNSTLMPFTDPNFPADETKGQVLLQLVGANAQWQRAGGGDRWRWHVGAGPGAYRVVVQNRRKVLKDPVSKRLHQGTYLAGTAEFGIERFNKGLANTSLEWTVASHMAYATRDKQFVSGFNGNPLNFETRFGVHYYFDFNRAKKKPAASTPAGH